MVAENTWLIQWLIKLIRDTFTLKRVGACLWTEHSFFFFFLQNCLTPIKDLITPTFGVITETQEPANTAVVVGVFCFIFRRAECARAWTLTWLHDERRARVSSPPKRWSKLPMLWHKGHNYATESPTTCKIGCVRSSFVTWLWRQMT